MYLQLVLPAGQVEIITTGHMEDFEDATLIPRDEIDKVNEVILVGTCSNLFLKQTLVFS